MAVLNPGDEVVLFEPLYDTYLPVVRMLGANPRLVRWRRPNGTCRAPSSPPPSGRAPRRVLINTPMNPAGKVFTAAELAFIAELLVKHDAYAVCDEVYEHLTFDGWRHIPLMTLPGLRDRCMRVGSAGKTFSLTGWKVGYVTAPAALAGVVAKAHQNLTFTTPPNLQRAVAVGLARTTPISRASPPGCRPSGTCSPTGLARLGFGVLPTKGSYFVTADFSPLGFAGDDVAFCRHITEQAGVTAIPVSAFYEGAPPATTPASPSARGGGARGGGGPARTRYFRGRD